MYNPFYILLLCFLLPHGLQGIKGNNYEHLIEAVESLLKQRYPERSNNLEVRVVRSGGVINFDDPFEILLPETNSVPRANQRINVQNLGHNKSGWVLIYVAHFDSVLTINRSAKNDEQVFTSDLGIIWTETTRFHGEPLKPALMRTLFSKGDVFANRYIAQDRILKASDLRNAYDIATGQTVAMHYQRRGITLSLTCKARNQGYTGDLIKLYSPDTQLMYKARITGQGVATWVETLE